MKREPHPQKPELIFEPDAMISREVLPSWTLEDLLKQDGVFALKDLVGMLTIDSGKVKQAAKSIRKQKRSAWEVMGARKIWNHWVIRMKVFAPYYRRHLKPRILRLAEPVDANRLLQRNGRFFLTDVCKHIPFSAHQLRHQAKNNPNAKQDYGLWKDPKLNAFIVEMEVFSQWVRRLWAGHFSESTPKETRSCSAINC